MPAASSNSHSSEQPPKYRLYHFENTSRDLAEPVRLMLEYAGESYEDIRFKLANWESYWPEQVEKFEYQRVPVLEFATDNAGGGWKKGEQLAETYAILRYLAEKHGLSGADARERAHLDEFADFHKDVSGEIYPYLKARRGLSCLQSTAFADSTADDLQKSHLRPTVKKYFPTYVRKLSANANSGGFLAPSGLTWVDLVVADYLHVLKQFEPTLVEKEFPELEQYRRRVFTHPKLRAYAERRKHHVEEETKRRAKGE